ncbi:hypothetical protein ACQB60_23055 [Actinomycetota bacterium Odt1-20B]
MPATPTAPARRASLFAAALALPALLLGGAQPTAAATAPASPTSPAALADTCRTMTNRFDIQEGVVPIVVGYIDTAVNLCMGPDRNITTVTPSQTVQSTVAGTAAGFNFTSRPNVVVQMDGNGATVHFPLTVHACAPGRPLCSQAYESRVVLQISRFIGPVINPIDGFKADWRGECESANCVTRFLKP